MHSASCCSLSYLRALSAGSSCRSAAVTFRIAFTKVKGDTVRYFVLVGLVWLLIAVGGDYVFIVKAFEPADGYYKLDVYLYYALTLAIPLIVGCRKNGIV